MIRTSLTLFSVLACVAGLAAQQTASTEQRPATAQELKDAAVEVPLLVEQLELRPGMTAADVGAGSGGTTIVLSRWLAPTGRLYATDITAHALASLRDVVVSDKLANVIVVEGATASTNLADDCCDALFMRDVYHHITQPDEFNRSLLRTLKPGGRLAIIDFAPRSGSQLPAGVRANRGGHGITPEIVVSELTAAGFTYVRTLPVWPPEAKSGGLFLVLFRKPAAVP